MCALYYHTSKQSQNTGGYGVTLISLQESFYCCILRDSESLLESFYCCVLQSDSGGCSWLLGVLLQSGLLSYFVPSCICPACEVRLWDAFKAVIIHVRRVRICLSPNIDKLAGLSYSLVTDWGLDETRYWVILKKREGQLLQGSSEVVWPANFVFAMVKGGLPAGESREFSRAIVPETFWPPAGRPSGRKVFKAPIWFWFLSDRWIIPEDRQEMSRAVKLACIGWHKHQWGGGSWQQAGTPATAAAGAGDLWLVWEQGEGRTLLQSGCWLPVHRPVWMGIVKPTHARVVPLRAWPRLPKRSSIFFLPLCTPLESHSTVEVSAEVFCLSGNRIFKARGSADFSNTLYTSPFYRDFCWARARELLWERSGVV